MEDRGQVGRRRWLRWRIGAVMGVVAAAAVVCAVVRRPSPESLAIGFASDLLGRYQPGFDPTAYRADKITPSADGQFRRVHFTRVGGAGPAESVATVPDWRIKEGRRRFWEPAPKIPFAPTVVASTRGARR